MLARQGLDTRPTIFGRHESKMSLVSDVCDTKLAPAAGEALPDGNDSADPVDFGYKFIWLAD